MNREQLGRIAYTAYADYVGEGESMDTWEQLPESDRMIYRYIGEAVIKAYEKWVATATTVIFKEGEFTPVNLPTFDEIRAMSPVVSSYPRALDREPYDGNWEMVAVWPNGSERIDAYGDEEWCKMRAAECNWRTEYSPSGIRWIFRLRRDHL